jgi:hypothetical protein
VGDWIDGFGKPVGVETATEAPDDTDTVLKSNLCVVSALLPVLTTAAIDAGLPELAATFITVDHGASNLSFGYPQHLVFVTLTRSTSGVSSPSLQHQLSRSLHWKASWWFDAAGR